MMASGLKGFLVLAGIVTLSVEVISDTDIMKSYIAGHDVFTANIYKEIANVEKHNFIVSPFSLSTVMALTQSGAKGKTASEIRDGLHLPDSQEGVEATFQQIKGIINSTEDYNLTSANKIYIKKEFTISKDFKNVSINVFDADIEAVNFEETVETASQINKWVENKTNDKIHDLINPNALGKDTRMVLINALHFAGNWVNTFEKYATHKQLFYPISDDPIEVEMMHQTEYFNFYESSDLDANILEMPYVGDKIVMGIVLPNAHDGITKLEEKIEKVFTAKPEFTRTNVRVSLPKFRIETDSDMGEILKDKLRIVTAFSSDADFSGMIDPDASNKERLAISGVIQKAFINVDEEGTEAAAATAVLLSERIMIVDPNDAVNFEADHPFIYYIKHQNGIKLFIGKVSTII